jgi:hypothetical protein
MRSVLMKKGYLKLAGSLAALLLIPVVAGAWNFDYEIYGTILADPPRYGDGSLTSGADGFIEFTLSDDGWPVDPNQRFHYLWTEYFKPNYDTTVVGAYKWVGAFTGTFYMQADNAPVGYNGWCWGTIVPTITIWDTNSNGALDLTEKFGENLFDARLSKLCTHGSGGEMDCMWGWGAMASNYFSFKIPPDFDTLYNGGNLTLMPGCSTANEPSSWGAIKALYR